MPQLLAEESAKDLRVHRRRVSPNDRTTMCAVMIARTSASRAARNGTSACSSSSTTGRARCESRMCLRGPGSAWRARRPALCSPRTKAATCRATKLGLGAGADPDHGVQRVRVDVRHGREVQVHPTSTRSAPIASRDVLRDAIVDFAERGVPRDAASRRRLEPRHVAALVDRRSGRPVARPATQPSCRELLGSRRSRRRGRRRRALP